MTPVSSRSSQQHAADLRATQHERTLTPPPPTMKAPPGTPYDCDAAMSLSLLKFVGQASLVDDAMLPS